MKKNRKIHLEDLRHLYDFIAMHARCSDTEFDEFIFDLGKRAMKQADKSEGFEPKIYQMYAAFGIGWVLGNIVTIERRHEKIVSAIDTIKDEIVRIGLSPGVSLR